MMIDSNNYRARVQPQTGIVDPASLARDLGGKWHRSYGVAPCPVCQSERRKDQNALTINSDGDRLLLHCKKGGCDFRDILTAAGITSGTFEIDARAMEAAARERAEQTARTRAYARHMWASGEAMGDAHGAAYLAARGITCALPKSLRWLPKVFHGPSEQFQAAMIADVSPTGGLHRTFFTKEGQRLQQSAKMMLGPCRGGAVRLSEAIGPLVVCEGIETGLSLLSGLLSGPHTVWAALSTSGIKGLSLPARVGALIIAADGDTAGREAADSLARAAKAKGWSVSMMTAPDGQDWNDVLVRGVAV